MSAAKHCGLVCRTPPAQRTSHRCTGTLFHLTATQRTACGRSQNPVLRTDLGRLRRVAVTCRSPPDARTAALQQPGMATFLDRAGTPCLWERSGGRPQRWQVRRHTCGHHFAVDPKPSTLDMISNLTGASRRPGIGHTHGVGLSAAGGLGYLAAETPVRHRLCFATCV